MKAIDNIESIIQKYWNGETSLEEEKFLKEHFAKNPSKEGPEQALFEYFSKERSMTYTKEVEMPRSNTRFLSSKIVSIAASLLLLMAALWTFNNYNESFSNETIIDDPEVALKITKEAFALLNGKVGQSEQAIKDNIVHLDKTLIFKNL